MSYSRTVKFVALLGASIMLPSVAFANCGTTCASHSTSSHSSSHIHGAQYNTPALSSWKASPSYVAPVPQMRGSSKGSSYVGSRTYSSGSTYSGSTYGGTTANCPSGTALQNDGTCLDTSGSFTSAPTYSSSSSSYGSGSISATYSDNSATVVPFTSPASVPGLGVNESLVPTSCPVSVSNPDGGRVLGCYAVAKPALVAQPVYTPVTTYTRVVHPVIYVRYPVPTPVPYIQDVYVGGCGGFNTRYGAGYPGACGW